MRTTLDDAKVFNIWRCPDCGVETEVNPGFCEEGGIPMCGDCGSDQVYVRTEEEIDEL